MLHDERSGGTCNAMSAALFWSGRKVNMISGEPGKGPRPRSILWLLIPLAILVIVVFWLGINGPVSP
jgi:hypothetical protein